jgi:hypothetical protein
LYYEEKTSLMSRWEILRVVDSCVISVIKNQKPRGLQITEPELGFFIALIVIAYTGSGAGNPTFSTFLIGSINPENSLEAEVTPQISSSAPRLRKLTLTYSHPQTSNRPHFSQSHPCPI